MQAHLLRASVANLKIDATYALYPESFCDKYLSSTKYLSCFSSFILLLLDKNLNISLSKSLILFLDCPKHFPLFHFLFFKLEDLILKSLLSLFCSESLLIIFLPWLFSFHFAFFNPFCGPILLIVFFYFIEAFLQWLKQK